jgi:hypothetical protein
MHMGLSPQLDQIEGFLKLLYCTLAEFTSIAREALEHWELQEESDEVLALSRDFYAHIPAWFKRR